MIVLLAAALAGAAPMDEGTVEQASPQDTSSQTPAAQAAQPGVLLPTTPATTPPGTPATTPSTTSPAAAVPPADGSAPVPDDAAAPAATTAAPADAPQASATSDADAPPEEGGIVVTARNKAPPGDPVMAINKVTYAATQALDKALIEPAAKGYQAAVPGPIRAGLRHFFTNLTEPVIALNFLLQLHPGKAAETLARFAINSTIGVAGLADVAKTKTFKLPYRPNGFAYTMGYYGIKPGPFLFVPLVGPTTLRDVIGLGLDRMLMPAVVGGPLRQPPYVVGSFVVRSLNDRIANDAGIRRVRETGDPYTATKDAYIKQRQIEIDALKTHKHKHKDGDVPVAGSGSVPSAAPVPAAPAQAPAPAAPAVPAEPTTAPQGTNP